ncbi:nickel/cobalt ABC transporter permease [Niallia sp. 03133]|uniref:nickel/cobalt ABC transporter permease n=1 Tax=Niallia sp. 03133 TaxID=3458060 RepID=UPI0040448F29
MNFWSRLKADKMAMFCLSLILLVSAAGIFAPILAPHDPVKMNILQKYAGISQTYPLGTDQLGRCILSRLLFGIRTTILFALASTSITIAIGTLLGIISGFFRGKVDEVIMRICDMMLSFPAEVMILAIVGVLGPGLTNVVIANIIAKWAWYTRMIRSVVIQYTDKNYIRFAKVSGCSTGYIMRKHLFPSVSGEVAVLATLDTGGVILNISALSFLGLGVQAPIPEWGMMLNEAKNVMVTHPTHMLAPGFAILLIVAAFNFLGDSLHSAIHPKVFHKKKKGGRMNVFIPLLTGSKTPTSRCREIEEARWGTTARKGPISSTNHQWGMKKTPTDGRFTLLEVKKLSVNDTLSGKLIVKDASFALKENTCLCIVGESGSGKSLTAKAILGLTSPWMDVSGEAIFNGENLIGQSSRMMRKIRGQKICMILQDPMSAFNPLDTIEKQMIETFCENMEIKKKQAKDMARTALHQVHIHHPEQVLKKYPHQLSGGMLQRVMISIAMMVEPDIIIADEPTTALDSINQRVIVEQFKLLQEITGTSIIFISHDLGVAQYLADELLVMKNGECVEAGKAKEVFASPKHDFTQFLIDTRLSLTKPFQESMLREGRYVCEHCEYIQKL